MRLSIRILATAVTVILAVPPARPQAQPTGRDYSFVRTAEISGGLIGTFTPVLPTNNAGVSESATDSFGGLFSFNDHPVVWAGFELNYSFSEFTERFGGPTSYSVKTAVHEATGAYIFRLHVRKLQPFVALGGGYLGFVPAVGPSQWRGTGLVEAGLDVPTGNPHVGLRFQGRALIYRDPNYYNGAIGTVNWVATTEPMAGAWYRW